jgi:hypothetical protein
MKKKISILILLSGLLNLTIYGQVTPADTIYVVRDTQNVNTRLFESDKVIDISLKFNLTEYKRMRSNTKYLDAILTYHTSPEDSITKNIKVRARGVVRREICDFPPLLLDFKMKDSAGGEFSGIRKLKLVPTCRTGFEDLILREYLIYKLYNVLTDVSFKVRLLRITYINTFKISKPIVQYGFVIEPIKLLEKRTRSNEIKPPKVTQKNIRPELMNRFAIFNYMIGNTDWSVPIMHNALILAQGISDRPDLGLIVPFDFDYSGFVNAYYAVPFPDLPIQSVRDRYFLGVCRSEEEFQNALKEFLDKKEAFYAIINDFPYLNEKSKKDLIRYLDGFYIKFDKKNTILDDLFRSCIKL